MAGWNLDLQARVRWIEQCLELGVSTFDHADIYGDYAVEELFGQAGQNELTLSAEAGYLTRSGDSEYDGWWTGLRARWTP